ncbi:MAG: hypothetical protein ABSG31_13750 [Tepidisphaeraceae bacterium]|jgi:hypothetical protein
MEPEHAETSKNRTSLGHHEALAQAKDQLTAKLLQGLDSAEFIPFTDDYTQRKKDAFLRRIGRKPKKS